MAPFGSILCVGSAYMHPHSTREPVTSATSNNRCCRRRRDRRDMHTNVSNIRQQQCQRRRHWRPITVAVDTVVVDVMSTSNVRAQDIVTCCTRGMFTRPTWHSYHDFIPAHKRRLLEVRMSNHEAQPYNSPLGMLHASRSETSIAVRETGWTLMSDKPGVVTHVQ